MSVFCGANDEHLKTGAVDIPPQQKDNNVGEGSLAALSRRIGSISTDSDVLMTALLLWLLYKDGADAKLLLALAYIII